MSFINNLTKEKIQNDPFPLQELLKNSLYYPSCRYDGGVVRQFSKEVQSFVYCDYDQTREQLGKNLSDEKFKGYSIFAQRKVQKNELIPAGWAMRTPLGINLDEYNRNRDYGKESFCEWIIFEREAGFSEEHGPARFSMLYIGGEGVATYQALYTSNKQSAKILALIQDGSQGFGNNWTSYKEPGGPLSWVVLLDNTFGKPAKIIYGGVGGDYNDLNWPNYEYETTIRPYYFYKGVAPFGEISIWKVNN